MVQDQLNNGRKTEGKAPGKRKKKRKGAMNYGKKRSPKRGILALGSQVLAGKK